MELYYMICLFVFGTIFGSFFNVVGSRLAHNESIIYPSSHCTYCKHKLGASELIPILSYFIQGGKCKWCKKKLSFYYPLSEFLTGVCFSLCYVVFGFTWQFLIGIVFISFLIMIVSSDIEDMIIPDELLIIGSILIILLQIPAYGVSYMLSHLLQGICAFFFMWALKIFGDHLFHKESMGGGDIKLLFFFGLVLGFPLAVLSIFVGSVIGLPISVAFQLKNSHVVPFGPYLCIGAISLLFLNIPFDQLLDMMILIP